MNKVITDGVLLMPPPFSDGLDVYAKGNGTPGSDTYADEASAKLVTGDEDFGDCLEIVKTEGVQQLRYMGETALLPGCYLRVSARVKVISGSFPSVSIGAFAGGALGLPISGVTTGGPVLTLDTYGEVVEISAIIGAGARRGVDMIWGSDALFGHFGVDLSGPCGGTVRIDDLRIEDITSVYLRDMMACVDVRDYGAVGDGVTDDTEAFLAANSVARGRDVLVSKGTYYLAHDVVFDAPVRFEGSVTMPDSAMMVLHKNFNFPGYMDAFENGELALKKGIQALINGSGHETFDLGGRTVEVTAPIDVRAACVIGNQSVSRRVLRNGQLQAKSSPAWDTVEVTCTADYDPADSRVLRAVKDVSQISVGALVTGAGVGREVYVRDINVEAQEVTLSAALYDAAGTQAFTFRRFRYILDFSGFETLSKFVLSNVELQCNKLASGVMLAPSGQAFQAQDCFFTRPKDRAITSIGDGCQGMLIDRCQFLSAEDQMTVPERHSIGLNTNSDDIKLRNCRATKFRHFALVAGANNIISGNHFFQGDAVPEGVRSAGLIVAKSHANSTILGNYVDNCFVEWTNEQDSAPGIKPDLSFTAMSITDNIFLTGEVAAEFSYIVIKPYGPDHFLSGVSITGNHFRAIKSTIERAERVDTSFGCLDFSRMSNVRFEANSFHNVVAQVSSPLRVRHSEATAVATWVIEASGELPFGAQANAVDAIVATDRIRDGSGRVRYEMPYASVAQGPSSDAVHLIWSEPMRGDVQVTLRLDQ